MIGKVTRFLGRVLYAFMFISSGLAKLQGFYENSTKLAAMLEPRLNTALRHLATLLSTEAFKVSKQNTELLLYITVFLELFGGVCFIFFPKAGSFLLMLYLLTVTPIMHDFYNQAPGSQAHVAEMIHFLKNLALLGSLFMVLGQPRIGQMKLKTS